MKNMKYKVSGKQVSYTAMNEETEISGQFDMMFCPAVESKLLTAVCECHALDRAVFDRIIAIVKEWSKEKRPISFDYRQWFESTLKLASEIRKTDKDGLLNGIAYKKAENGRYQLMPAWYYLSGSKKAFINYVQSDFGLKVSKYEREQLKKMPLPKTGKQTVSPVTVVEIVEVIS